MRHKNGLKTSLPISLFFFFLKMSKIWVGRTTLNGEKKKRMALKLRDAMIMESKRHEKQKTVNTSQGKNLVKLNTGLPGHQSTERMVG